MVRFSFLLIPLLGAAHLALAHFLFEDSQLSQEVSAEKAVHVIFEKHVTSGTTALTVWDTDRSRLFGYSCNGSMPFQDSVLSVEFSDDMGYGNLEFQGKTYSLDFDPKKSGGISCARRYSPVHAVAECFVPIADALPKAIKTDTFLECFDKLKDENFMSAAEGALIEVEESSPALEEDGSTLELLDEDANMNSTDLEARQIYCERGYTYRFNDGSPRALAKHTQLTNNLACAGAGCSIGQGQTQSITHTASFGANSPWTSAGYSVSFSTSHTETHTCSGRPSDTVCIWNYHRYQRYQCLHQVRGCTGYFVRSSGRYDITAPMNGGRWWHNYCVVNTCRAKGDSWWENYGSGEW